MIYKAPLNMKECPTSSQTSEIFECMELTTSFKGIVCNIYIVYCIPNTSVIQLCSKLSDLMESNVFEDCRHLIMLDGFNIHVNNPEHPDTVIFNDFLESFDLTNFITFPSHVSRHTLDLVIMSSHRLIKSIKQGHFLLDHCFVDSTLHVSRPVLPKKIIKFCKLKSINSTQIHTDLWECLENQPEQLDNQVKQYNIKLHVVLDKHASIKEKRIRDSHHQPWFNDKIMREIVLGRKKKRTWLQDQSEYSRNTFYVQHRHLASIIKTTQWNYYKEIIHENYNDYKAIFNITNSLLFRKTYSPMPNIKPLSALAEGFSEFFCTKIAKIMDKLKLNVSTQNSSKYIEEEHQTDMPMHIFMPVFHTDVTKMVTSVPPKSCKLDPMPMKILKDHIGALAHRIAKIINTSFDQSYVCDSLKEVILRPLIKSSQLDPIFPNFRPVSNLAYIGKLAELMQTIHEVC